ncbi:MAG: glycosyltransferase [Saprospiraceae bacterium]|nr:glycosyltransferase [Saprospiraceae bacterium]
MSISLNQVVIIGPALKMGGMERASANLANALNEYGLKVTFISLFKQEKFFSLNKDIKFYEPETFNSNSLSIYKTVKWVRGLLSTFQNVHVIVFNKFYSSLVLLANIGFNNKIIISERSSPLYKWNWKMESISNSIYRFFTPAGIIAQTNIAKQYQQKFYGYKVPIAVIPNALKPIKKIPEIEREKIILAVGRFNDELKGFDRLLNAFALIKNKEWNLVFSGGDENGHQLKEQARQLGISDRITYLGQVKDIDIVFAQSSIFVIPSRSEGFPNALCEAMAAGLACISFDFIAGPRDLIENDVNGVLIKDGDIESLAKTIDFLIENPVVRLNLGRESEKIIEKLSPKTIATKTIEFLHEIK